MLHCNWAVYQVKDTIFWKQITTSNHLLHLRQWLFIKSKIQFFESKSQLLIFCLVVFVCCLSSQRYNFLKANHNLDFSGLPLVRAVYQVKDTIFWKQITTVFLKNIVKRMLFIKSKIQFFESKSQHNDRDYANLRCCLSSQRYNFLKANHNKYGKEVNGVIGCLSSQRYNFLKANHN